ncbi:hypothetical protein MPER_11044 [Moniliophthora perniciosa FA553]|nr:hypothetical protein MPER_11044 [Moniliophthora perniciosa FA553]
MKSMVKGKFSNSIAGPPSRASIQAPTDSRGPVDDTLVLDVHHKKTRIFLPDKSAAVFTRTRDFRSVYNSIKDFPRSVIFFLQFVK